MQRKHSKTLELIFKQPTSGNIKFKDIENLLIALGADVTERAGSRIAVVLQGQVKVFHRPHPSPDTDKGAVVNIRKWLDSLDITPETLTIDDESSDHE